jgi:dTDP-4-amino-4,6-dideoxygalactose transaminase
MTSTSWDRFRGHAFDYDVIDTGLNYRPTELAAAIGRVQLGKLADNNARRRKLLERYATNLRAVPGLDLADTGGSDGAGHLAVALLADRAGRDRVLGGLRDVGVQTSLHYPPVHLFEYFRRSYGYAPGDLPAAEDLADRAVTLPLYPRLPEADVDDVCEVIRAVTTPASGAAGGR